MGQHPPGATGAQYVADGVDYLPPRVGYRPPARLGRRQQGFQQLPFSVAEVAGVSCSVHLPTLQPTLQSLLSCQHTNYDLFRHPLRNTGDTCDEPGLYIASHCTPPFRREFQPGDEFTKCHHGQWTSWQPDPMLRWTKANVCTAVALATITIVALFLIWPPELGPDYLQDTHVPFLYEARKQAHGILLIFASQAMLLVILSTRQPKSVLALWAIISVAILPFAAELNRMNQDNPTQNLVAISSCVPIFIKMLGHAPTGKSILGTLVWLGTYAIIGISVVAVLVNTRLGPILAIVFGKDVVEGAILFVILGACTVVIPTGLLLVGIARSRMLNSQIMPNNPGSTQSPPNR